MRQRGALFGGPLSVRDSQAIALVRANRPGSVQTIQQATYVQEFEVLFPLTVLLNSTAGQDRTGSVETIHQATYIQEIEVHDSRGEASSFFFALGSLEQTCTGSLVPFS